MSSIRLPLLPFLVLFGCGPQPQRADVAPAVAPVASPQGPTSETSLELEAPPPVVRFAWQAVRPEALPPSVFSADIETGFASSIPVEDPLGGPRIKLGGEPPCSADLLQPYQLEALRHAQALEPGVEILFSGELHTQLVSPWAGAYGELWALSFDDFVLFQLHGLEGRTTTVTVPSGGVALLREGDGYVVLRVLE